MVVKWTTVGPESKGDLYEDGDLLRSHVERLINEGKDVIVLMHSYGGAVGGCAFEGLPAATESQPGILMLIWMSSFVLRKGEAIFGTLKAIGSPGGPGDVGWPDRTPKAIGSPGGPGDVGWPDWARISVSSASLSAAELTRQGDYCLPTPEAARERFYTDLSDEDAAKYIAMLEPIRTSTCSWPVKHEPWHDYSCMYFYLDGDMGMKTAYQEQLAEILGERVEFRTTAGHSPWISQPKKVIEALDFAIAEGEKKRKKD